MKIKFHKAIDEQDALARNGKVLGKIASYVYVDNKRWPDGILLGHIIYKKYTKKVKVWFVFEESCITYETKFGGKHLLSIMLEIDAVKMKLLEELKNEDI